jgi:bifunctional DNA-binding transcriptional regulator/antitoxin component of YhaV-PrlF toxin-antitoxin module
MTVAIRNNNKMPLVVPKAIRRKAGFKSGQELEIKASGGVITILPKLPSADEEYTARERRAIDRAIAQSEKEYRAGNNAGPFDRAEEFAAAMEADLRKLRAARRKTQSMR